MLTTEEYFKKYNNEEFYFHPNPGNGGDSLIAIGTYHFFNKLNIKYTSFSGRSFNPEEKSIIYSGGGNLGKMTNYSVLFLNKIHNKAKKIIILPHTIKEIDPLLKSFRDNVYIFCREQVSYDYVRSVNPDINLYLDHDMAFHTDISLLSERMTDKKLVYYSFQFIFNKLKLLNTNIIGKDYLIKLFKYHDVIDNILQEMKGETTLNCFRLDGEKTSVDIPDNNYDISEIMAISTIDEYICSYIVSNLFYLLKKFELIRTNRLHIAISCALLGLKVEFYPNNYFKCEAIYRYSIENKFPNVIWKGN
jgi:exopolysaccharide biosynthesis predicted pyruvyltransferase EpsI